ncbi:MAG: acetyl-CoA carboxylase biotin carboxylase subunit [Proteobacteria bacterium]|nr:acetyl-CoA carboxylase biotin carboxylase subunit [Pseudomonadota bacterium]
MTPPFRKVLIANRGEIAVRVIRACRELGIIPIAVFSEADRDALHVRQAFEAYCIGPAPSAESYLRMDRILEVAREAGAEAIHPGYGFLAENAVFAGKVVEAGMAWIGAPPAAMQVMGDKVSARQAMLAAGVPVVPGTTEPLSDDDEAVRVAAEIGYPVMIKASAGGGGKGMRRVESPDQLASALRGARSEAGSAFGDDRIYVEKCIDRPRHVEVQIFSDGHGHHLHLFERDCSVQRRHQKLVEETPCPVLTPETRAAMTQVATRAAAAVDYRGAGTVEFLLAPDGNFYFLEMNTRLQVEHPITELVTGVDLVHAQIAVAAGEPAPFTQDELSQNGHAIEVRICAEDPANNFVPCPGRIDSVRLPGGPWVRVDGAMFGGYEVPIFYDPMLAKLVVWGRDRPAAIQRMKRALSELVVSGIRTNIPFFIQVMRHGPFVEGDYDTGYIERHLGKDLRLDDGSKAEIAAVAAALAAFRSEQARARRVEPAGGPGAGSSWTMAGRLKRLGRS